MITSVLRTRNALPAFLTILALALTACGPVPQPTATGTPTATAPINGDVLPAPTPTAAGTPTTTTPINGEALPSGWQRVQVRQGFMGREFENPLAGFTIDLPPGWRAGETWPSRNGPSGWIAGVAPADGENVPVLRVQMGAGFKYSRERMARDPHYEVAQISVEGVPAFLHLAASDAIDLGPQVGIFYDRIPGGTEGQQTPSLSIEGDSRGFTDQALLGRVLKSARYAEIAALPDLPAPGVVPDASWARTAVRSDPPSFSLLLPPGWQTTEQQGIDSWVGTISGDGTTLHYDFAGLGGSAYDHISRVREHPGEPLPLTWEERIGERLFWFVRPVSSEADPQAATGGLAFLGRNVSIYGYGLDRHQQETVLAMLRTLALESE